MSPVAVDNLKLLGTAGHPTPKKTGLRSELFGCRVIDPPVGAANLLFTGRCYLLTFRQNIAFIQVNFIKIARVYNSIRITCLLL